MIWIQAVIIYRNVLMMQIKPVIRLIILGFLMGWACRSSQDLLKNNTLDYTLGKPTEQPDSIQKVNDWPHAIQGKMKVMIQTDDISEKGSLEFWSNDSTMLLYLKNQLGIEGMHILVDSDSVLEYNRIDKQAFKLPKSKWQQTMGFSALPITLSQLLFPFDEFEFSGKWFETNEYWQLPNKNFSKIAFWKKSTGELTKIIFLDKRNQQISVEYSVYKPFLSFQVPKRIAIFTDSPPQKISIQVLDVNQLSPDYLFSISVPESVRIIRVHD